MCMKIVLLHTIVTKCFAYFFDKQTDSFVSFSIFAFVFLALS